jgi:hypothetical protein
LIDNETDSPVQVRLSIWKLPAQSTSDKELTESEPEFTREFELGTSTEDRFIRFPEIKIMDSECYLLVETNGGLSNTHHWESISGDYVRLSVNIGTESIEFFEDEI